MRNRFGSDRQPRGAVAARAWASDLWENKSSMLDEVTRRRRSYIRNVSSIIAAAEKEGAYARRFFLYFHGFGNYYKSAWTANFGFQPFTSDRSDRMIHSTATRAQTHNQANFLANLPINSSQESPQSHLVLLPQALQ